MDDESRGKPGAFREALAAARRSQTDFNGLIQHSFALRVPDELKPQYAQKDISDPRELLSELLTVPGGQSGFCPMPVADMGKGLKPRKHSLIVGSDFTDIVGHALPFAELGQDGLPYPWPHAFGWANSRREGSGSDPTREQQRIAVEPDWDRVVPSERDVSGRVRSNDYLVVGKGSSSTPPCCGDPVAISWLLCQLLAHRRSRLFGWSLERRIFNVLLPHALLRPVRDSQSDPKFPCNCWLIQPSLSLFLTNKDRSFRSIFSFTLFAIPVQVHDDGVCICQRAHTDRRSHAQIVHQRQMSDVEIGQTVQAGWNIATSPRRRPEFVVSGPLCRYVAALDPTVPESLRVPQPYDGVAANGATWGPLRLRKAVEVIAMATVLRLVAGPGAHADTDTAKRLGEKVLVALSSSRASSVLVVDDKFKRCETEKLRREGRFPGSLGRLMEKIGVEITVAPQKKYRLDRAFFDSDDYAIGVLPADRCVVVTADPCAQRGNLDSGLLEAGWIAYMIIGAATATGMMRSIYHEIEQVSGSNASAIANIEREVVVDLHEIYDLDITWSPYRERYRLLRDRFGITRDYESLQSKLLALSRESSTRFEDAAQKQLIRLTRAIVLLTILVVVVALLAK